MATFRAMTKGPQPAEMIESIGQTFGMIPTELFQQLFALINPMQAATTFRKLDNMELNSPAAIHFVAIKDWLSDGVPLVAPSAKGILIDRNLNNTTANGHWKFQGKHVHLSAIRQPTLNVRGPRQHNPV